jgi:hypothetical protein
MCVQDVARVRLSGVRGPMRVGDRCLPHAKQGKEMSLLRPVVSHGDAVNLPELRLVSFANV